MARILTATFPDAGAVPGQAFTIKRTTNREYRFAWIILGAYPGQPEQGVEAGWSGKMDLAIAAASAKALHTSGRFVRHQDPNHREGCYALGWTFKTFATVRYLVTDNVTERVTTRRGATR